MKSSVQQFVRELDRLCRNNIPMRQAFDMLENTAKSNMDLIVINVMCLVLMVFSLMAALGPMVKEYSPCCKKRSNNTKVNPDGGGGGDESNARGGTQRERRARAHTHTHTHTHTHARTW